MEIGPALVRGTLVTLQLSLACIVLGTLISLAFGYLLMARSVLVRAPVRAVVEVFRGTSLVVQLFWIYFVFPQLGILLDPWPVGIVAVSLNVASYGGDAVRGAVEAVPRGQREAAKALSMSPWTQAWRIVLPQALIRLIPPWGNQMIETIKVTSVVSFITINELTFIGYQLNSLTFRTFEVFGIVILVYFALSQAAALFARSVERIVHRRLGLR